LHFFTIAYKIKTLCKIGSIRLQGGRIVEKIVIEEKQSRALRLMCLGFVMLILSIVIWIYGMNQKKIIFMLLGFLSSVFFCIYFLFSLGRSIQRKPLLTITFDGIIDSTSSSSVGFIPFQDIEKFCVVNIMGQKVIGVIPKDENDFITKLSPLKQRIAKNNVNMQIPPLSIKVDKAKDMSLEDVFTLLKKRLDDYSSLYD
jgi:hypothetical protein